MRPDHTPALCGPLSGSQAQSGRSLETIAVVALASVSRPRNRSVAGSALCRHMRGRWTARQVAAPVRSVQHGATGTANLPMSRHHMIALTYHSPPGRCARTEYKRLATHRGCTNPAPALLAIDRSSLVLGKSFSVG